MSVTDSSGVTDDYICMPLGATIVRLLVIPVTFHLGDTLSVTGLTFVGGVIC